MNIDFMLKDVKESILAFTILIGLTMLYNERSFFIGIWNWIKDIFKTDFDNK